MASDGARAVVSLATERYGDSLARLERSLERAGFDGRRAFWPPGTFPAGCPDHDEVPFAFKPFCVAEAAAEARYVFWLDSTCVAVQPLGPLFAELERRGYLLFRNRDRRLGDAFRGVGDDGAHGRRRLKWNESGSVSTDRRVRGHRHDQTVAGILAHQLGMEPIGVGFQAFRRRRRPVHPSAAIVNRGRAGRFDGPALALGLLAGRAAARARLALR